MELLLKYESIKVSWFYLIVLHPKLTDYYYITVVSLNFQYVFFCCCWLHEFFDQKTSKNQRNEHKLSKIVVSVLKIGMILAFIIIYPLNIWLTFFWAHWEKMVLLDLSSSSEIFLYIFEVFNIAPRSCLYHIIEKRAPIS